MVGLLVGAVLPVAVSTGCAARPTVVDASARPYDGPPIRLEHSTRGHRAVIEAPTAGWSLELDSVADAPGRTDVFVTIRRPDPGFAYSQAVVTQRLATGVRPAENVRLLARVLAHDASGRGVPYVQVDEAEGREPDVTPEEELSPHDLPPPPEAPDAPETTDPSETPEGPEPAAPTGPSENPPSADRPG